MKACDHIRSILLTDYVDGELDNETKKGIESHLANCPECTRLVTVVKEEMSIISDKGIKGNVPPHLWTSILKRIEEERPRNTITDIIKSIAERLTLPKLVPALVGIVLLVLSASFFLYTQYVRQDYGSEESFKYASELFAGEGTSAAMESEGLGTPIEEYFL